MTEDAVTRGSASNLSASNLSAANLSAENPSNQCPSTVQEIASKRSSDPAQGAPPCTSTAAVPMAEAFHWQGSRNVNNANSTSNQKAAYPPKAVPSTHHSPASGFSVDQSEQTTRSSNFGQSMAEIAQLCGCTEGSRRCPACGGQFVEAVTPSCTTCCNGSCFC
ncbi:hypothetical protein TREMEDRAFT_65825 [Tremella mesenterica DSM 1558]|uniref:uncharacterized protein n=1 Tax=Tremella mesenterica (strain ATCC 24925 / CBS 8224 / DSM 1558 / NBRC 9311 / NRRL Y-6157 / RJB 2259-6 / UBC 559-6) TaxID=578456 RepID=UPI00032BD378|nr:uncharacterized protein TREMEDRAFT_65825 [Tremella mesenterica DSM 1558]EIW66217.1 hypothetical protein TREMEDRAFT_65825 [Tremella mesenterica DSM 1558]